MTLPSSAADVVLVVPIAPAPTGNGLAMRAGMWLDALAGGGRSIDLVVVPVSGPASVPPWAADRARTVQVVEPLGPGDDAAATRHAVAALADPRLRARIEATAPLPHRVRSAPPTLAVEAAGSVVADGSTTVVVLREYLVPFGVELARRAGAGRVVVDLDDDAEALLVASGRADEAGAVGRLARAWLPDADVVVSASALEVERMAARYGLDVTAEVPNSVVLPDEVVRAPGADRVLYVGNLTYGPNVDAVSVLVGEVLPAMRAARPGVGVVLVGDHDERLAPLGAIDGVELTGQVADLAPHYAAADVVVVPLRQASGTRIKVLEAMAHRRPVVATPTAVEGLALDEASGVLVAADPAALAAGALGLLADRAAAEARALAGEAFVRSRYAADVVAPRIRALVLGDGQGRGRGT